MLASKSISLVAKICYLKPKQRRLIHRLIDALPKGDAQPTPIDARGSTVRRQGHHEPIPIPETPNRIGRRL